MSARALAAAILLLAAAAADAQGPRSPDLPNPAALGDEKAFEAQGIAFRPPEGCIALESEGPLGQRVITASRIVKLEGREEVLGLEIEIFRDVDFATYRAIAENAAAARGQPAVTLPRERLAGREVWRADLPSRDGPAVRLLAVDAGDRVVAVHWAPGAAADREFGRLLAACVESLRVEYRDPPAAADAPAVAWNRPGRGASLKYPEGWRETDRDAVVALQNPRDRFETLAFGHLPGTVEDKEREWEKARKDPGAAARPLDSRRDTFLGRDSFEFTAALQHQGIEIRTVTRLVAHRGRLVFVAFTARAARWEDRKQLFDAVLATLELED